MKSYYSDFPRITYKTPFGEVSAIDILTRFKLDDITQSDPLATYSYTVQEGDRPDIIAKRYYGSADYAWIVMLSNDFFSANDSFPLTEEQLNEYCQERYGEDLHSTRYYVDPFGSIIDQTTYLATPGSFIVTNYDYELTQNEAKRDIKLISKVYLRQIIDALGEQLEKINKAT